MNRHSDRHWWGWASWGLTNPRRVIGRTLTTSPRAVGVFLWAFTARHWRVGLLLVGLVVQAVLTVLMWQLVDLTISLMEVWAELARKHLEIVLS
jgi:hypothetical protein